MREKVFRLLGLSAMRDLFTFISELKLSPEVRDFRPPITGEMKGGELL